MRTMMIIRKNPLISKINDINLTQCYPVYAGQFTMTRDKFTNFFNFYKTLFFVRKKFNFDRERDLFDMKNLWVYFHITILRIHDYENVRLER